MNKAFEKILKRLEEREKHIKNTQEGTWFQLGFNVAKEIVQKVAEEYNGGWIPCSKGLPKVNEKVLTTHENGMVQFATFTKNKNFVIKDSDGDLYIIPVIAWQPLPEPYKE